MFFAKISAAVPVLYILTCFLLLPPATKLGQGNIFRNVCQEFCSHPGAVHAGRYGQQAGGTHPTGMHTCHLKNSPSKFQHLVSNVKSGIQPQIFGLKWNINIK